MNLTKKQCQNILAQSSSWACLLKFGSDEASFYKELIAMGFAYWRSTRYYRHKFQEGKGGRPAKIRAHSLFKRSVCYFNFMLPQSSWLKTLAQLHGIRRNHASIILCKAEIAFAKVLENEALARIAWPDHETQATSLGSTL